MAAVAQPRAGRTSAGQARRGRHTAPRWAEQFPDTPEGFDALETHKQARQLPRDTDPDTIEDADVREEFLRQLMDEHGEDEGHGPAEHTGATSTGRASSREARGRASSSRRRTGKFGAKGLPAPSLSPADGSGFMLGLVLYALALNYIRYGPAGVRQWLAAKFLNREMTAAEFDALRREGRTERRNLHQLLDPPTTPGGDGPPRLPWPTPGPTG